MVVNQKSTFSRQAIIAYGHIPKTGYFLLICWKLRLNPLCYLKQALQQEERDVSVLGEEAETA